MKQLSILFLVTGFLVATTCLSSTVEANGQVDQILSKMQKEAQKIKNLHAKMDQVKRLILLGGTETYRGEILFKHAGKGKDKLKIIYTRPAGQTVWVVDDQIVLYQPNIKQAIITSRRAQASQNQEFALLAAPYSLTSAQIKARYEPAYVGEDKVGAASTAVLELTPKTRSAMKKMKLWVDKTLWLPIKSEVVEQTGDVSTFVLSEVKLNSAMSDGVFKVDLPSGTKKIVR